MVGGGKLGGGFEALPIGGELFNGIGHIGQRGLDLELFGHVIPVEVEGVAHDAPEVSACQSLRLRHDGVQVQFLKVFRALPSFRIEGRFRTWLYTIAVNVLNDERRAARRRGPTTELREVTMPVHGTAQDSVHRAEDMERVRAVLSGVRRDQRQLFVLVRLGGLRVAEAAATVGMSISAARMTLLRIGERLGQELSSVRENSE